MTAGQELTSTITTRAAYRRFGPYLRPYWGLICVMMLALVIQVVMDVLSPWPVKFIFDSVIGHHQIHGPLGHFIRTHFGTSKAALLELIIVAYITIALLDGCFSYIGSLLVSNIGQRFVFDMRRDLFAHIQRLSLRFHLTQRTGDLMARVTGDISNIQDMVVTALSSVFVNGLTVIVIILVMLRLDLRYTLLTMVVVPFIYLAARHYRREIKHAARQARRSEGRVGSIVQEVFSSIRVVKAFTREDFEQQRFEEQSDQSLQAGLHSGKLQAQFAPIIDIIGAMGTVLVLWLGVSEVLAGRLTAGELLVFMSYYRMMYSPLRQLAKLSNVTAKGSASAERVVELLDTEPDLTDLPTARPAPRLKGRVTFDHVSFGYEPDRLVLHDISFEAEPGTTTALVGATGSGKTSTLSMIPRFYDPISGSVRVDGKDVRNLTLASLRAQVSLVLQEPVLFRSTIYDNIAYGSPHATREQVYSAAQDANAMEFIERLEEGFDTLVGERGASLSGGQRQRIAIARAIVRDAPLLVLDEPTVGLDVETEHLVLEALQRLMADRTTFVIAHNLYTIQRAHTILVLDQGRIVEMGAHEELLARKGPYARLYYRQFRRVPDGVTPAAG
ncbi:MAG TPA: ABC transporter ATP-binding protein [Chloroflexota bacterium]